MVLLEIKTEENIQIRDTKGISHSFTAFTVLITLAVGWAAFFLSIVFNILYYALHPSQVYPSLDQNITMTFLLQVDLLNIKEKRFVMRLLELISLW